jgi:hypothetical protein
MAEGSIQQQVQEQFKDLVQPKYGIDAGFVKHYILRLDHVNQAAAAESAGEGGEDKKKGKEARLYVQNPHRTAKDRKLSVSYQLLLQHLLTLLSKVRLHAMACVAVHTLSTYT